MASRTPLFPQSKVQLQKQGRGLDLQSVVACTDCDKAQVWEGAPSPVLLPHALHSAASFKLPLEDGDSGCQTCPALMGLLMCRCWFCLLFLQGLLCLASPLHTALGAQLLAMPGFRRCQHKCPYWGCSLVWLYSNVCGVLWELEL